MIELIAGDESAIDAYEDEYRHGDYPHRSVVKGVAYHELPMWVAARGDLAGGEYVQPSTLAAARRSLPELLKRSCGDQVVAGFNEGFWIEVRQKRWRTPQIRASCRYCGANGTGRVGFSFATCTLYKRPPEGAVDRQVVAGERLLWRADGALRCTGCGQEVALATGERARP